MTIINSQASEFLTIAAGIKINPLYPNLDCVLILNDGTYNTYTKTNNNVFCRSTYKNATSGELDGHLVPERVLRGICQISKHPTTIINRIGSLLSIKSGSDEIKVPIVEASEFPKFPVFEDITGKISGQAIDAIRMASKYSSAAPIKTAANFVNIGENGIFATDQEIVFYKKITGLPQIFIDTEALLLMSGVQNAEYRKAGNYDVFISGDTAFAFIKTECISINYDPILSQEGGKTITVQRQAFLDFCDLVDCAAKKELPIGVLGQNGAGLQLTYIDPTLNIDVKKPISHSGEFGEPFSFPVRKMKTAMSALPYNSIILTRVGPHFRATTNEDPAYVGFFASVQ